MAENENVVEQPAPASEKKPNGNKFLAGVKERLRKFAVKLKRKPQTIAFFVLILSTVVYMCSLATYAQATLFFKIDWTGLVIFINTVFSILSLLLFMNTFPKRKKKMNYVMLALTFVFMAVMIFCDAYWFVTVHPHYVSGRAGTTTETVLATYDSIAPAFTSIIVHLVLVAISAVLLATLPLYKKLIFKINTSKKLEENELSGEIDTSAEV